ncbi:MAG TPA: site-specific integrase [Herpetosiphonaceae bacterium]|nr:site-specific integrase [Herpetosiphonaceae bacterium]
MADDLSLINDARVKDVSVGTGSLVSTAAGFNAPALLAVVGLWANTTTDQTSPRLRDLLRDKTNVVMGFLDFCHKPPALVTPEDVRAYQADLSADGLQPSTVYTYLQHVSSFYEWAMEVPSLAQAIRANPVRVVRPKAPQAYASKKTKALSDDQVAALLDVVRGRAQAELPPDADELTRRRWIVAKRDLAILLFFLLTGMRRREVIQLHWGDIELRRDGSLVLRTQVKGGRNRTRKVEDASVQTALVDYLRASGRFTTMHDDSPLWARHDRAADKEPRQVKPLTSHAYYQNLQKYAQEALLGRVNPHKTRHTYAAWVGEESGSLHEVQQVLGHRNLNTTRVYLEQIAVEPDRYSSRIARRLGLPTKPSSPENPGGGGEH